MALLEALVVVGVVGLIVYGAMLLLLRRTGRPSAAAVPGQWLVGHYDKAGTTYVVLQKVAGAQREVVDEHVIATIPVGDPDYDQTFLTAMSVARERRALFETENDP